MSNDPAPNEPLQGPLADEILDLFARAARVDRQLLQPDVHADAVGVTSLDLTLALFELEDHFDIQLPDPMGGRSSPPTVGELVQQVLDAIRRRDLGARSAGAGSTASAASAVG